MDSEEASEHSSTSEDFEYKDVATDEERTETEGLAEIEREDDIAESYHRKQGGKVRGY